MATRNSTAKQTHGLRKFDQKYYQRFFVDYNQKEFKKYLNWFEGWFRFIDRYQPLKNNKDKKALEIGCSLGYFAAILDQEGYNVTATDISEFIVKKAKKINPQIDFQVLNIQKNKKSEKYDYIFAFEVFEHLSDPETALKNCYKMLEKKGVLVFSTPFVTKQALADPTHINVHKPSWWLELCNQVGFKQSKIIPATFIPFLYQLHPSLSRGFRFKFEFPFINTTAFYICKK